MSTSLVVLLPEDEIIRNEEDKKNSEKEAFWILDPSIEPLLNIVTFGWVEDGRCGYVPELKQNMQLCPKPVASLRLKATKIKKYPKAIEGVINEEEVSPRYVCKSASTGSRHTLLLMIDTQPLAPQSFMQSGSRRLYKVMIMGLNQVGLCEEKGYNEPIDVDIKYDNQDDRPESVIAGRGISFILTKQGILYSFGNGNYGTLGHGNVSTIQIPTRIHAFHKKHVLKVAIGSNHALAIINHSFELYAWGRNDKGQLGLGFESKRELNIGKVSFGNVINIEVADISCGQHHSMALVRNTVVQFGDKDPLDGKIYCWGDESRGQLGSGDAVSRMKPQENLWLTKFLLSKGLQIDKIYAGGYHNLILLRTSGQVISWGANEYGQLGNGFLWDDSKPKLISSLKGVIYLSAGLRHNIAVTDINSIEVFTWGYNGNGELGLGDTDIRLQPTHISAIKNTKVVGCDCGEKHSIVLTSHIPIKAKDDSAFKPYFKILQAYPNSTALKTKLKINLLKLGLDPEGIEDPERVLPNQVGSSDLQIKNDVYSKGLRYCLDTFVDKNDWRRKGLETCYECYTKTFRLKSACIACARNCLFGYRLRPYVRSRTSSVLDICDCRTSGLCQCAFSLVRSQFDKVADEDKCIAPRQVRTVLKALRAPYPVDGMDVEDCLNNLAEGREDEGYPRIQPVLFENWYRKYFDERDDDIADNFSHK